MWGRLRARVDVRMEFSLLYSLNSSYFIIISSTVQIQFISIELCVLEMQMPKVWLMCPWVGGVDRVNYHPFSLCTPKNVKGHEMSMIVNSLIHCLASNILFEKRGKTRI